jgi:hypothetical protein
MTFFLRSIKANHPIFLIVLDFFSPYWYLKYCQEVKKMKKAIEITGTVDKMHRLLLDEPIPIAGPSKVRVIILLNEEADIEESEWLRAATINPAFDFLKEQGEDIYTAADGKPFHD